jgi:hypothetical protein
MTSQMSLERAPRKSEIQPSKQLMQMIDGYFTKLKSFKKLIHELKHDRGKIFEQGRNEGLTDIQTGDILREKLRPIYSDRQIQRFLPDCAKHTEKVRPALSKSKPLTKATIQLVQPGPEPISGRYILHCY